MGTVTQFIVSEQELEIEVLNDLVQRSLICHFLSSDVWYDIT